MLLDHKRKWCILVYFWLLILVVLLPNPVRAAEIPAYAGEDTVIINDNLPFLTEDLADLFPAQYYGELDDLGRCTGVYAYISQESMPEESRGNITEIEPTGWHRIKMNENGDYLYNRCHLIGYQLTGQNANERNLITGTNYLNVSLMKPYEDMIAQYVKGTGNHVMYRVTPMFEEENLLATGVLLEGLSIEDNTIGFCVFCYNVQPGIELDYLTGNASGKGLIFDLTPEQDTAEDTEMNNRSRSITDQDESDYVVNRNTKKFHYPYCDSVNDMKAKNRIDFTGSREELIDMGYTPCKRCNP